MSVNKIIRQYVRRSQNISADELVFLLVQMVEEIADFYDQASFLADDIPNNLDSFLSYLPVAISTKILDNHITKRIPGGRELAAIIPPAIVQHVGKYTIGLYEKRLCEKAFKDGLGISPDSTTRYKFFKLFRKKVESVAKRFSAYSNIRNPDFNKILQQVLLESNAFWYTSSPVIAVVGKTCVGKSTLINSIFKEDKVAKGYLGDTTQGIMELKFDSNLKIYDTPGIGGDEKLEQVTRAYLGLSPLQTDDKQSQNVSSIPVKKQNNYVSIFTNIEPDTETLSFPDAIIFVMDIGAPSQDRVEQSFLEEIVQLGIPVILTLNKADLMESVPQNREQYEARIKKAEEDLRLLKQKYNKIKISISGEPVLLSAYTGKNINELLTQLVNSLPHAYLNALSNTVRSNKQIYVLKQEAHLYSMISALIAASLVDEKTVDKKNQPRTTYNIFAITLGLYIWIENHYGLDSQSLDEFGLGFRHLASNFDTLYGPSNLDLRSILGGTLLGASLGVGIAALPIITSTVATAMALFVGVGGFGGGITALMHELTKDQYQSSQLLTELGSIGDIVRTTSKYEAFVSMLAFGTALSKFCEKLTISKEHPGNFKELHQTFWAQWHTKFLAMSPKLNTLTTENIDAQIEEFTEILWT